MIHDLRLVCQDVSVILLGEIVRSPCCEGPLDVDQARLALHRRYLHYAHSQRLTQPVFAEVADRGKVCGGFY